MKRSINKIVVIGLGNILLRDDGIGVRVIEQLCSERFPKKVDVKFIDGGLKPDLSVFLDKEVSRLIIIDAAETGDLPGSVRIVNPLEIQHEKSSIHGIDLQQNMELMRLAGTLPESVFVVGIQPGEMSPRLELTEKLTLSLPLIMEKVRGLIVS